MSLFIVLAVWPVAAEQPLTLWQVDGDRNRVYLLGSIHLLRESDYPIPTRIYAAYDDAETLIMELDMDDIDALSMQSLVAELGMLQGGDTLASVIGPDAYATAEELAGDLQIPLSMLQRAEPWLAAMTVEVMIMTRLGFDPQQGIEHHLMSKAGADNKEIRGLETERQQLEMLDSLPAEAQADMLMQTLREGHELETVLDQLISAWKNGDTRFMQETMLQDMQDSPALFDALVESRNRNWVTQIEALLDDDDDYLVVVGALHLVGDVGVPSLLERRGRDVEQLRQD